MLSSRLGSPTQPPTPNPETNRTQQLPFDYVHTRLVGFCFSVHFPKKRHYLLSPSVLRHQAGTCIQRLQSPISIRQIRSCSSPLSSFTAGPQSPSTWCCLTLSSYQSAGLFLYLPISWTSSVQLIS
uniref:Uncharacterized protein n=3 Tax=Nothobranchius TaxID=28779 RepID=A0A1A8VB08_NOTFU